MYAGCGFDNLIVYVLLVCVYSNVRNFDVDAISICSQHFNSKTKKKRDTEESEQKKLSEFQSWYMRMHICILVSEHM